MEEVECKSSCRKAAKKLSYYEILNVSPNATAEQIILAYRQLAIRLHPDLKQEFFCDMVPYSDIDLEAHLEPHSKEEKWALINGAYNVLGNFERRKIYDKYGDSGLKGGLELSGGNGCPYHYDGNHMRVFRKAFGTESAFSNLMDGLLQPANLCSIPGMGTKLCCRNKPLERFLTVTLEEVYTGATKIAHFRRKEPVDKEQQEYVKKTIALPFNVPPGIKSGTRFIFREAGDRQPFHIPSDIVYIIQEQPHAAFERLNDNDLLYKHEISLREAITGFKMWIKTLDKRLIKVTVTDIVTDKYTHCLEGEGLPKCQELKQAYACLPPHAVKIKEYGDLYIKFKIHFPKFLTRAMKLRTRDFFRDLKYLEKHATEQGIYPFVNREKNKRKLDVNAEKPKEKPPCKCYEV